MSRTSLPHFPSRLMSVFLSRTSLPHVLLFFKGIWNYLIPVASKRLGFPLFLASLQFYVPRLPFSARRTLLATHFIIISGAFMACLNSTKLLVFPHNGKTKKNLCKRRLSKRQFVTSCCHILLMLWTSPPTSLSVMTSPPYT